MSLLINTYSHIHYERTAIQNFNGPNTPVVDIYLKNEKSISKARYEAAVCEHREKHGMNATLKISLPEMMVEIQGANSQRFNERRTVEVFTLSKCDALSNFFARLRQLKPSF